MAKELKTLVCPYCGGEIYVYASYYDGFESLECENSACSAEWYRDGTPKIGPREEN